MEDTEQIDNGLNNSGNTAPPVLTTEQIPSDSNSKKKLPLALIVGVLIFFILAAGASGFFLFQKQITKPIPKPTVQKQTPTPTANADLIGTDWKTYTGNGFEFKYPSNGKVISDSLSTVNVSADTKPYFMFMISVQDNLKNLTTKQVVDNLLSEIKNNKNAPWAKSQADQMQQTMKDYSVGQTTGIKLQSFDEGYPQKFGKVVVVKNNKIYTFNIGDGSGGGVSATDEKRLDQILSTFKFTDSQKVDTSNWKMFQDVKVGLEFKYPNNWYIQRDPKWTLQLFIEDHPFEIIQATEFLSSIQIGFNEVMNTVTNKLYYPETTLDEKIANIRNLYDPKTFKVENLRIAGKETIKVSGNLGPGPLEGSYFVNYYIQLNNRLLSVQSKQESEEIAKQILSTFKFTQ